MFSLPFTFFPLCLFIESITIHFHLFIMVNAEICLIYTCAFFATPFMVDSTINQNLFNWCLKFISDQVSTSVVAKIGHGMLWKFSTLTTCNWRSFVFIVQFSNNNLKYWCFNFVFGNNIAQFLIVYTWIDAMLLKYYF